MAVKSSAAGDWARARQVIAAGRVNNEANDLLVMIRFYLGFSQ
jgi:hypothetical protein